MLTPMDIHNHQFKKSFRGYNENEVDDFLDRIVVDFEKLLNERDRYKNQTEALGKEIEQYRKLEKTLNETLMVAQRTADEVISSAKKNAENLEETTARECQNIREQAQFEAKQLVDNATIKRDEILADYNRLVREKHEFLLKLRTMLESELAITNQTLNTVPQVDEPPARPAPKTVTEIFQNPASVETPEPVDKPAEEVIVSEEILSEPVEKIPSSVETPVDADEQNTKIVDISTKSVTDDTIVYKPAKKISSKKSAPKAEGAANS